MRVLLISGSFPPMKCGVGDYTARLAASLGNHPDTTVGVLTDVAVAASALHPGVEVIPIARGWNMSDAIPIVTAARCWRPDIIHMQFPTQGYGSKKLSWLLLLLLTLIIRKPNVQTWHDYFMQKTVLQLKLSLYNLPNVILPGGVIVVRPNYKAMMAPWYRWLVRHKQIQYIPNASVLPIIRLSDVERAMIRAKYCSPSRSLVVYFGFVYPAKGVEMLFDIIDPSQHDLVLMCDINPSDPYHQLIINRMRGEPWRERARITGFLPAEEASQILSTADAVVLPFREGGGNWNTSLRAASEQGAFTLTTSCEKHGYDSDENVYYARPDDIVEMRQALITYIGRRSSGKKSHQTTSWNAIADAHIRLYTSLLK